MNIHIFNVGQQLISGEAASLFQLALQFIPKCSSEKIIKTGSYSP